MSIEIRSLWLRVSLVLFAWLLATGLARANENLFAVLSYHDVVLSRDELTEDAVTLDHLVNHFEWLLAHGYHPVSVTDILAARAGDRSLPSKAVLLTFDDGYDSFYEYVFPLLKAYKYPAVLALVGSWMETPEGERVAYGKGGISRDLLLSWQQVSEIDQSGLVEVASHSFDLHKEVLANAQGNRLAAGASLTYNKKNKSYETREAYRERVRLDLEKAQANFKKRIGHEARVIVWPYGRYTDIGVEVAVEEGFEMALTLDREPGMLDGIMHAGRYYMWRNPTSLEFREMLESPLERIVGRFPLLEAGSLSGDAPSEEKQLALWLERCSAMHPDGVCIRPYDFKEGKVLGFFPSRHLPMAEDRLLRLIWQTRTRGRSRSILWLVNDRKEWGWKDEEMIKTWPELGPQSPVFGVVIGGSELTPALIDLPWNKYVPSGGQLAEQSPGMRRQRRQAYLKNSRGGSPLAIQTLKKLESFQAWQPYARVYLQLSWPQARAMDDDELNNLLMIFDRLILDARGVSIRELTKDLKRSPLQHPLTTHGQILVDFNYGGSPFAGIASRRLAGRLKKIEALGILSWIYDRDWPVENRPDMESLRPMMSAESFPWNDPEFRLWSEAGDKQEKKKEGR